MTTGKTTALTRWTFVGKVMSLLFNMLSRLVITFLPRSKRLLISWLQSPSAVILEPKKIKSLTVSIVFPPICHEVMGPDAMILVYWLLSFKPPFDSPLSPSSRGSLVLCFLRKGGVICTSEVLDTSPGNLDSSLHFIQPPFCVMNSACNLLVAKLDKFQIGVYSLDHSSGLHPGFPLVYHRSLPGSLGSTSFKQLKLNFFSPFFLTPSIFSHLLYSWL